MAIDAAELVHFVTMSSAVPVMPVLDVQVSGSEALPLAEITVLLYGQLSIASLTRELGLDSRVDISRRVLKAVPHLFNL